MLCYQKFPENTENCGSHSSKKYFGLSVCKISLKPLQGDFNKVILTSVYYASLVSEQKAYKLNKLYTESQIFDALALISQLIELQLNKSKVGAFYC